MSTTERATEAMTAEEFWRKNDWSKPTSPNQLVYWLAFAEAYAAHATEALRAELSRIVGISETLHHLVHPAMSLAECRLPPCDQFKNAVAYEEFMRQLLKRAEQAEQERDRVQEELNSLRNAPSGD